MALRGIYNVNKPSGMTSSDVVVKVRGILRRYTGERLKVGHLGTLDPLATGVLPITVGTATKLFDFFSGREKTYVAKFSFGYETTTLDSEGETIKDGGRIPTLDEIQETANALCGDILQTPPLYSAKSIDGRRAYAYARKGIEVELTPKQVHISEISAVKGEKLDEFSLTITCGSGTYVRAIGRDIASKLNTYATMTALTRVSAVGGLFALDNAVTIDQIQSNPFDLLVPLETALADEKTYELPKKIAVKVLNGIKMETKQLPDGDFVVTLDGQIISIGGKDEENFLLLKTRL